MQILALTAIEMNCYNPPKLAPDVKIVLTGLQKLKSFSAETDIDVLFELCAASEVILGH